MADKKVTPTRQATGWETLTGQATPTREATAWEKLTGQATPTREASWWEKATGEATPTREASTWERLTNQATPTRQATWWENLTSGGGGGGGGGGSFGFGYALGQMSVKVALFLLVIVIAVPGLLLDKLFPDRHGADRLWLYSLLFWPLVVGPLYLQHCFGTPFSIFALQLLALAFMNVILGAALSQSLYKARLPLSLQTIFDKSERMLPSIGWLGFVLGLFCLTWSLAAQWPFTAVLPAISAMIGGSILIRPILARRELVTWFVGLACIAAAVFHLVFGWNVNLVAASVPATHEAGTREARNARSFSAEQGTSRNLTLEENVRRFAEYLQQNEQLSGRFEDYLLVTPPSVKADASKANIGTHKYEIAFVGPHALYTFSSADGGIIWAPLPPTDPYLRKLAEVYTKTRKRGPDLIEQVESDMNLDPPKALPRVALPLYDWPAANSIDRRSRDCRVRLNFWLEAELKKYPTFTSPLHALAETICSQAGWVTVVSGYSHRGDTLWAVGECPGGKGFICSSSDNGGHWVRQWYSTGTDPVYGIHFADSREGWTLTLHGILHTSNGGSSWARILKLDHDDIENLFIVDRHRLIVTQNRHSSSWHATEDGGASWNEIRITEKQKRELQEAFGGPLRRVGDGWTGTIHYGGVFSKEGTDKE